MFRQLVAGPGVTDNINSLFTYHPLQLSALIETVWLNRNNADGTQTSSAFVPWSPDLAGFLLKTNFLTGYTWAGGIPTPIPPPAGFVPPLAQPGLGSNPPALPTAATNWDHLIYAYVIENTRIFEIFSKVLETYMFSEELETPSPQSQLFWRNLEFLIFGDSMPSMLWTTTGRLRRDEVANRLTSYYWMFGIDLSHASEIAVKHPYQKPAAANRDFIPTFEAFAREVWRGIMNVKNSSGANETDPAAIATLARRLYDMMATRRINGNLSREEFRAVAVMSFLHLAVMYDSPAVVDLKASASSPEMRLQKIAERVHMTAHPQAKPFFDLPAPFSVLMPSIETNTFSDIVGAETLYFPISPVSENAETVIDQYTLATGRDLKSRPVALAGQTAKPPLSRPPAPRLSHVSHPPHQGAHPQLTARPNGHAATKQ